MRLASQQPIQHSQAQQLSSAAAAAVAATASISGSISGSVPQEGVVQATTSHLSNEFYQHYAANIATFNHMYKQT